jgi:hypothetical protein
METNRACDCERSGENASERATGLDPYAGAPRLIHGRAVAIIMPVPKRKALKRHLRHTELPSPARGEGALTRTALASVTWVARLLPKEEQFFPLFEDHADKLVTAAGTLQQLLEGGPQTR